MHAEGRVVVGRGDGEGGVAREGYRARRVFPFRLDLFRGWGRGEYRIQRCRYKSNNAYIETSVFMRLLLSTALQILSPKPSNPRCGCKANDAYVETLRLRPMRIATALPSLILNPASLPPSSPTSTHKDPPTALRLPKSLSSRSIAPYNLDADCNSMRRDDVLRYCIGEL